MLRMQTPVAHLRGQKKKKCPVAADAEVSNLKQLQGVGVEQLYSTLDSLGTYTR